MISAFGQLSLCLAVLASAAGVLAGIAAVRFRPAAVSGSDDRSVHNTWMRASRWMIITVALSFTIASIALLFALGMGDYRFTYVAAYTDNVLPMGYKLAAFWAGQEGSLLIWAWLLGVLCIFAVFGYRKLATTEMAITHSAMAAVCGVFAAFLLFAANPFNMFEGPAPPDGRGLNPMLQDPAMLAHPPLLFLGYAGYTIPFAVLIGVLVTGRRDDRWVGLIRRWSLISWFFLGAGIIVGGWWAYLELGWGGYWAWDPVENASLLPWLTGTALLHSIMVQQRRGMFRYWNASLIAVTFILCIFGTYLTRSGIVDSVHTFAGSPLASCFLIFIIVCLIMSAGMIYWRRRELQPDRQLEALVSREGAFLAANVLLVIMMLITLLGTISPVWSGAVLSEPISAREPFYNRTVTPLIVLLAAIMALGPVLVYGKSAPARIGRSLVVPAIGGLIVAGILLAGGIHSPMALIVAWIAAMGTLTVIAGFTRSVGARRRSTGEAWAVAGMRLIDRDHRRYGGQIAHLGVMMMVVGVAGSGLYSTDTVRKLSPGESFSAGGGRHTLTFVGLEEVQRVNHVAVQATVRVEDRRGNVRLLYPERRFYRNWEEKPQSQVALRSGLREDVYLTLAGWEDRGRITAIQAKINPLVIWIWIGSIVMGIGAIFCMLPRLLPRAAAQAAQATRVPAAAPAAAVPAPALSTVANGWHATSIHITPSAAVCLQRAAQPEPVHAANGESHQSTETLETETRV